MTIAADAAATVALQALAHLAADPDRLQKLMENSGLSPDDLRQRATDPAFLGGVLDYLLMDEAELLVFCEAAGLAPELPARARAVLP